jgi:hypothetical protein
MSFVKSSLVGTGNALVYQLIDTVSQYSNTMKPLTTYITNGEIIMISSGLVILGAAYYAWKKGYDVIAAFGVELGPLLIVSGILDIIKRKFASLSQVALVRRVPPTYVPPPAPAASGRLPFTSMD